VFVDAHVHIDRFPRPPEILAEAEAAQVVGVAVTETPRDSEMLCLRAGRRPGLRVALGTYPMRATQINAEQLRRFSTLLADVDQARLAV
jgi:Tat protein secretion system quality control protein TatD with DNase activity